MDDLVSNAPEALVAHCRRAAPRAATGAPIGSRDAADVAGLITWLNERDEFSTHDGWVALGMALKLEYADSGLDLWRLAHDDTVSEAVETSKWNSFATEPKPGCVTIASILKRAHSLGWKGSVRPSTSAMFSEVAQLAANAGASLSGMPMLARGDAQATLWAPTLASVPHVARTAEHPEMPDTGHPLRAAINAAIPGIIAALPSHTDALAVIEAVHPETAAKVGTITPAVKARAEALRQDAEHRLAPSDYVRDHKGEIQRDNPDNVSFLLTSLGITIRWNAWLERVELEGWKWSRWTELSDNTVAILMTRAAQTGTRFTPAIEFFWRTLLALSRENTVDPVLNLLTKLQSGWDGTPRLSRWLTETCGTPDDAYHQAVSNLIIGGMVRRIRQPGCKHDIMPVLFGPQGTGKSTIAKIIADMGQSTLAQIDKRSTPLFSDEIMLGDESKELVLSLAGKCLVEIGEMGQRGSAKIDHVKSMLSRQVDRGRTAYARAVTERPRRNVFFGTVNGDQPLQDESGNRRFLPVAVPNELNLAWLSDHITQLIGEAATLEAAGADFALPRTVWADATERQEAARAQSDFEIHLNAWFGDAVAGFVTAQDLTSLVREATGRAIPPNQYGNTMRNLGFESKPTRANGRVWSRGEGGARFVVHRDGAGRSMPRQMFASVGQVVPLAR